MRVLTLLALAQALVVVVAGVGGRALCGMLIMLVIVVVVLAAVLLRGVAWWVCGVKFNKDTKTEIVMDTDNQMSPGKPSTHTKCSTYCSACEHPTGTGHTRNSPSERRSIVRWARFWPHSVSCQATSPSPPGGISCCAGTACLGLALGAERRRKLHAERGRQHIIGSKGYRGSG